MHYAMALLRLLQVLCRHGLLCEGLSPAQVASFPAGLNPTLLINARGQSERQLQKIVGFGFRGPVTMTKGGRVVGVAMARAVYADAELPENNQGYALCLSLAPLAEGLPVVSDATLAEIGREFPSRLLQYRLDSVPKVRASQLAVNGFRSPLREIARSLGACIHGDDQLANLAAELFRGRRKAIRFRLIGSKSPSWRPSGPPCIGKHTKRPSARYESVVGSARKSTSSYRLPGNG